MKRAFALALLFAFSFHTKTQAEELSLKPEFLVKAVLQSGKCTFPSFSPDDSKIAFVSNLAGRPNIFVIDKKGGWPRQITALDEDVIGLTWSPSLDQIAFIAGQGKRKIYTVKSDGTELFNWSNPNGNDQIANWLEDGKELLSSRLGSDGKNTLSFYGGGINRSVAQFGDNDKSVYFVIKSKTMQGFARIKFDEAMTPSKPEMLAEGNLLGFVFNQRRDRAILCFKKENELYLSSWNTKNNKLTELTKCPGRDIASMAISHDEKNVAVQLDNWFGQGDIWLFDFDTNRLEQLTQSPHAGFNPQKLAKPKFEKFHAPGTEEVNCTIYEPIGHKNERIAFVLDFGTISDAQVAALNLLGIGVMQPDFSSIESHTFDDTMYKAWTDPESRRRAITTIQDCISYLVKEHAADQSKIGVMGHSFNGYITNKSGVKQ